MHSLKDFKSLSQGLGTPELPPKRLYGWGGADWVASEISGASWEQTSGPTGHLLGERKVLSVLEFRAFVQRDPLDQRQSK